MGYFTFVSQGNYAYPVHVLLVHLEIGHQRLIFPCTHSHVPSFWMSCVLYSPHLRKDVLELVQAQRRVTSTMKCVVSHIRNN